jgi:hypothetical protein
MCGECEEANTPSQTQTHKRSVQPTESNSIPLVKRYNLVILPSIEKDFKVWPYLLIYLYQPCQRAFVQGYLDYTSDVTSLGTLSFPLCPLS